MRAAKPGEWATRERDPRVRRYSGALKRAWAKASGTCDMRVTWAAVPPVSFAIRDRGLRLTPGSMRKKLIVTGWSLS